ncbi:membrane protein YdfJ [Clostridium tepidiprofundi DSM 19306]|uniref:Membrane protein YdfJ n=1 Tax=Clostridium tepidiprofundi DSM 19306 TaxID=1121338 RepID=A0A151B3E2_9CLOT|nr:MMPL family transporter [Clostridium tepidiprofundi]KYH34449.1 membrane protein YdfJ [Clostridium tepidiprofundi DSM 19306]
MKRFGRFIAKNRILVLIVAVFLLIPSFYGYVTTGINYDLLSYLPKELDSTKAQDVLTDEFDAGAVGFLVIDGMDDKHLNKAVEEISDIKGVEKVDWIGKYVEDTIPREMIPEKIRDQVYNGDSTLLLVKFSGEQASKSTQYAIGKINRTFRKQAFLSGTASVLNDTKDLSEQETPTYVIIAVVLSIIVLSLTMRSTIIPIIFLLSIGFSIAYNLGSNVFLGEISYVTKSLAAVLQLAVTMDYSIFLLHRYEEELGVTDDKIEAMSEAIKKTVGSIFGSSLTTIAGFLALCSMKITLGRDIGLVMAKGVFLGIIVTVTLLPALILIFDKIIHRFSHKTVLPEFDKVANLVTNKYKLFIAIFLIAFIPAIYGQRNVKLYYDLTLSIPQDLPSIVSLNKLKDTFDMRTTHMIVLKDNIPYYKSKEMIDRIEKVKGINSVMAYDKFVGPAVPDNFISDDIKDVFKKGGHQMIVANSKYKSGSDEENAQIDSINKIIKEYDKNAMIGGEGALTKDLIEISDVDFKNVNFVSILAVFAIILIVFKSISLPAILVMAIELAIFINMGVPYYTGTVIPFVASIVIGCIQLGATVDYAILMTTRFREEIRNGYDKFEAMRITVKGSAKSIVTSALTFFAATVGVGIIASMELIKSLCIMMARGALISMGVILFILPSLLLVLEKVISFTTLHWREKPDYLKKYKDKFKKSDIPA